MVDTLEYLRRGGRIGAASAWIGATLKVKPILTIEGEMRPVERVRTAGRAFERLVAHLEQRHEDGCDAFAIQHVQAPPPPSASPSAGARSTAATRRWSRSSARSSAPTSGPGVLGVAGLRTELLGPM